MKLFATTLLALLATTSQAAEFRGILATDIAASFPFLQHTPEVSITSISGDGSTLGGTLTQTGVIFDCATNNCGITGFVWSHSEATRRDLGELPLNSLFVGTPKWVPALSFDGATALATYEGRLYESALHRDGVLTPFRDQLTATNWLEASAMTPDAGIIVGTLGGTPFHWSESGGIFGFAGIGSGSGYVPSAISHDASTTVFNQSGYFVVASDSSPWIAMQWRPAEGPSELIPIDGYASSNASAISADGSVVVGTSMSLGLPNRATVWIDSQPAPLANIGLSSSALDVSADGKSIVGLASLTNSMAFPPTPSDAVLWKNGTAYFIEELLAVHYGLANPLEGWHLTAATAISHDGTVIAGHGIAPDGSSAAWVAVLQVPEPSSGVLVVVAMLIMAGWGGQRIRRS